MAKVYQCDACGKVTADPYDANMKEFYEEWRYEFGGPFLINRKKRKRVHLCDDCFKGLNKLFTRETSDDGEIKNAVRFM